MALLLFIVGCLVAELIAGSGLSTTTEGQEYEAWRAIEATDKYHLMYRSFEYDERLGGIAKCVSVKLCEDNDTNQTAKFRFMYRDAATATLKGFTARASAARSPGSKTSDIIRIGNADMCDAGCELWVKEGYEFKCENGTNKYLHDKGSENAEESNDSEGDETQRAGGLGQCIKNYAENCGCPRFYVYDKEICSSSSKATETVETTSATAGAATA